MTSTEPVASKSKRSTYKPKRFRLLRKFGKSEDGASIVEFSFIALPMFLMIGGIMEFSVHFFANSIMDHGVEQVARKVRTNQITGNTHNEQTFKDELCNIGFMRLFNCNELQVDLQQIGSFQAVNTPRNANGSLNNSNFGFNPGGRVSINVLRVYYEWPTFLAFHKLHPDQIWSNGKRLMVSSKAFRIEP